MASFNPKDVSHVPKFDGTNFSSWKFLVMLVIRNNDLEGIVLGTEQAPTPVLDANRITTNEAEIKAWRRKDISAQTILTATLEQQPLKPLMNCRTSAEMWTRLTTLHEQNARENKHLMQQQFFEYAYQQGNDVMSHITAVETLATRLSDLGAPMDDHQVITKIICTLPPSFRHAISAWDNVPDADKTIALLTTRLLKEETMNKIYGGQEDSDSAFFARRDGSQRRGNKRVRFGGRFNKSFRNRHCDGCGKDGHLRKDCWHEDRNLQESDKANMASNGWDTDDFAFSSFTFLTHPSPDQWYADSGASKHMTDQRRFFTKGDFKKLDHGTWPVRGIGGKQLFARGHGNIAIRTRVNGEWKDGIIYDALFVPHLGVNLLSIPAVTAIGVNVTFKDDDVTFQRGSNTIAVGSRTGSKLYLLDMAFKSDTTTLHQALQSTSRSSVNTPKSIRVWHERLGHLNLARIRSMVLSGVVTGLHLSPGIDDFVCHGCAFGKQHRLPFPTRGRTRADKIGQLIHSDLCGPMNHATPKGARFYVIFKDDFSGYRVVHFLKQKSEAMGHFKDFVAQCRIQTGHQVVTLRSDNGGEFTGESFSSWLRSEGIQHQTSAPYCPEQNGVAERDNRTIMEAARSMLHGRNLPPYLWAEAVNTAVYLLNRVSSSTVPNTPYQTWHRKVPDLSHLRAYGSDAFYHVPKGERRKLDPKSLKCVLVGYCDTQKAYRVWDPVARKIRIGRDIIFDEGKDTSTSITDLLPEPEIEQPRTQPDDHIRDPPSAVVLTPPTDPVNQSPSVTHPSPVGENEHGINSSDPVYRNNEGDEEGFHGFPTPVPRRTRAPRPLPPPRDPSQRQRRSPGEWWMVSKDRKSELHTNAYNQALVTIDEDDDDPITYQQAIKSNESVGWKRAMEEEYSALLKNGTWILTTLPEGRSAIKNKWVYKKKRKADGSVERFKARLVAKGYSQRPGIDFDETFSPVVRHDSIRTILSIAAVEDLEIIQLDVKTAFLNGELEEDLFMEQPEGFVQPGRENDVCHLKRSLYGLKQASRTWNKMFNEFLTRYGLVQSDADPCVYHQQDQDGLTIVCIWVDDALVCSTRGEKQSDIVQFLQTQFEMTSGSVESFVGLEVVRNRPEKTIHITQHQYIQRMLQKFGMLECKPLAIPADPHTKLLARTTPSEEMDIDSGRYREAVGSLQYAAICTRPDICYAVNQVAQYSSAPNKSHWEAIKRIFRYLSSTSEHGLCFGPTKTLNHLKAYADADYAGNMDTRRSTTGFVFLMNGGPVTWATQRQRCTSLSTTEAEYIAQSEAAKEVVWARRLLEGLGFEQTQPTPFMCDNMSSIRLVKNPELHRRSKHIDVRYHFVREQQENKTINVLYTPSVSQLADLFTKALPAPVFQTLRHAIGMNHPDQSLRESVENV